MSKQSVEIATRLQRNCNEKESTGTNRSTVYTLPMQTSKQIENEPTVGNNFFENIPPVGNERNWNQWKQPSASFNYMEVNIK